MSKELMYVLIAKMHIKLNEVIKTSNYDLLCKEVQHYSRRLDKVLSHYTKIMEKGKKYQDDLYSFTKVIRNIAK